MICANCGTENRPEARFCDSCAAPLAAVRAHEQRKVVTVLFCDVSGSTALGERLDPEALRRVMSAYFETARAAIERHGGTLEKFIGDAVMAVFGVPTVREDDALRAARAAAEIRDAAEIPVRIGVNTGEVVTGGGDSLVTGDAVNIAARASSTDGPPCLNFKSFCWTSPFVGGTFRFFASYAITSPYANIAPLLGIPKMSVFDGGIKSLPNQILYYLKSLCSMQGRQRDHQFRVLLLAWRAGSYRLVLILFLLPHGVA